MEGDVMLEPAMIFSLSYLVRVMVPKSPQFMSLHFLRGLLASVEDSQEFIIDSGSRYRCFRVTSYFSN